MIIAMLVIVPALFVLLLETQIVPHALKDITKMEPAVPNVTPHVQIVPVLQLIAHRAVWDII